MPSSEDPDFTDPPRYVGKGVWVTQVQSEVALGLGGHGDGGPGVKIQGACRGLWLLTGGVAGHELVSQELLGLCVVGSGQVHGDQDAGVWEGRAGHGLLHEHLDAINQGLLCRGNS